MSKLPVHALGTSPLLNGTYADSHEELVEVDTTVVVSVEECHQCVGLIPRDSDLDFTQAGVELVFVDLVVSIEGVEVPESSAEATDGLSTPGLNLRSNLLKNYRNDRQTVSNKVSAKARRVFRRQSSSKTTSLEPA